VTRQAKVGARCRSNRNGGTFPHNPLCAGCKQDLLRACPETLGVSSERPCLASTLRKFAEAGAQAGIDTETLIRILRAGVPISTVLDLIQSRLERVMPVLGLRSIEERARICVYEPKLVFVQGAEASAVFVILRGRVKVQTGDHPYAEVDEAWGLFERHP
jgi:hypothetical protein